LLRVSVHGTIRSDFQVSGGVKFRHKGLQSFFERDDARRLPGPLVSRLRRILSDLADARQPEDIDLPGYRLHALKGDRRGQWSIRVSGNWRVTCRFAEGEAVDIDLVDYH